MEWINLPAYQQKSFYGKAKVAFDADRNFYLLKSYDTIVCAARLNESGLSFTVIRLWEGYSATTLRHVNSFLRHIGCDATLTKAAWENATVHPLTDVSHPTVPMRYEVRRVEEAPDGHDNLEDFFDDEDAAYAARDELNRDETDSAVRYYVREVAA